VDLGGVELSALLGVVVGHLSVWGFPGGGG
jgi:hypothetical protein